MPLYEYQCDNIDCVNFKDRVQTLRAVDERNDFLKCRNCGEGMGIVISAPSIRSEGTLMSRLRAERPSKHFNANPLEQPNG